MLDWIPDAPPIACAVNVWGVSRLQVHEICSRRLVYREVVEARSNYSCVDLEIPLVLIGLGVKEL